MSRIRSKNTSLEVEFRKLLWKNGLGRYRIHYNLPGKPDIVYVSKKIVVFIDGDFWHGYNWKSLARFRLENTGGKRLIKILIGLRNIIGS